MLRLASHTIIMAGALATVLCVCAAASTASALTLHKAVVFSRHGIRVPFSVNQVPTHFYSKDNRSWFENPADWGGGGVGYLNKRTVIRFDSTTVCSTVG